MPLSWNEIKNRAISFSQEWVTEMIINQGVKGFEDQSHFAINFKANRKRSIKRALF
jgi:hypothetical protein